MTFDFTLEQATREQAKLRLAMSGPGGAGKTIGAMKIARALVGPDGRVAVADTEFESASKYAPAKGQKADNEHTFDFLRIPISGNYDPRQIPALIKFCTENKIDILVIDSMSHFWNGVGGFLQLVDEEVKKMKARGGKPDSFAAWKEIDPIYKQMVQAILSAPLHVICTLRAKTEYEKTTGEGGGKSRVTKLGMAPEMRDTFQYEMDIEGMLDMEHNLVIGKTRCSALDGKVFHKPGADVAAILRRWLDEGDAPVARKPAPQQPRAMTDEQKKRIRTALAELGVTEGQAAYVESINNGTMPETELEGTAVLAVLDKRVAVKREQHTGAAA